MDMSRTFKVRNGSFYLLLPSDSGPSFNLFTGASLAEAVLRTEETDVDYPAIIGWPYPDSDLSNR